ncbi:MarR family winged helix-turn-helix transcriptional regulator [candidate division KSB1 bacterium]
MTDEILIALRKIIRAIDLYSKKLGQQYSLTVPQLILLREIEKYKELNVSDLARKSNLSNATVTSILDRLEKKELIIRNRSTIDKRQVMVSLTDNTEGILAKTPPLLQENFIAKLRKLEDWEQTLILSSLQRIASMMEAGKLDATTVLVSGTEIADPQNLIP